MNTLKTIYKSFLLVGLIALGLTFALALFCRIYWGGVMTEDSVPENTVVMLGESIGLDDVTKAAKYSPLWIDSNAIDVTIQLENEEDGTCIVTYDENTRTFSAIGVGKGSVTVTNTIDKAVAFTIPFETKFRSASCLTWLAEEAKDNVITAEELAAVTEIHIDNANDTDVIDLQHLSSLTSIVIDVDAELLHLSNTDTLPESVLFFIPKTKYDAYVGDAEWQALATRVFPDMGEDGCTVVFELNGGLLSGYQMIGDGYFEAHKAGDSLNIGDYIPTRTGYTFQGWKSNSASVSGTVAVEDNMKLSATWSENEYTIQYDVNGSNVTPFSVPSNRVTYSQQTTISNEALQRTGYTFRGWAESANATVAKYQAGQAVSKLKEENNAILQLYAIWEANEYALYYYELSETNYAHRQSMVYDETITIRDASSTKTGYKFAGWTTTRGSSTVVYKPGQTIKNLVSEDGSSVSLYAVWEPIEYLVCYYSYGETSGVPSDHKVKYGESFTLSTTAPQKVGYTFLGWSLIPSHASESQDSLPASDYAMGTSLSNLAETDGMVIMLYAVWKADTFKIVLGANGGNGSSVTLTATYGKTLRIDPEVYNKKNYGLVGWSLSNNAKSAEFELDLLSEKDIGELYKKINSSKTVTIYAVWSPAYTIKYDANQGESTPKDQSAIVGEKIKLADEIKRMGYVFVGWRVGTSSTIYNAEQSVKDLTTSAGATVTLKAEWKPITYTIRYDMNGATTTIADLAMEYDKEKKISSAPTREGYTFGGWEYDGAIYAASTSVKNLTTKNGAVIVMKAIWNPK